MAMAIGVVYPQISSARPLLQGQPRGFSGGPAASRISTPQLFTRRRSSRMTIVAESYRRDGGAGDFLAGFVLGGVVFGALGYLLAPQATKPFKLDKENGKALPKPTRFVEDDPRLFMDDDEETIEKTRKSLKEKISQLNEKLDSVSAQMTAGS